jgi:hypothetical protein
MTSDRGRLPGWLEGNALLRKLFLAKRIWLTRRSRRYYSQFGEDVVVGNLFPRDHEGFFVDVGCYHPVKYSNTYALYRRGWRGINIDIDPVKIEAFELARGDDVNIACAVSTEAGEVEYYSRGSYSLTNTLDADFAASMDGYEKKRTRTDRLDALIDGTRFAGRRIDFLTVDTEAHDLEVLCSLDFERYAPSLVAVELHRNALSRILETELWRFLAERGYDLVGWCGPTLLMASPELRGRE